MPNQVEVQLKAAEETIDFIASQLYADTIVAHERRIWEAIEEYRDRFPAQPEPPQMKTASDAIAYIGRVAIDGAGK